MGGGCSGSVGPLDLPTGPVFTGGGTMPDHLDTAKRELAAHFGAGITPQTIEAIVQAIAAIIAAFQKNPPSPQPSRPAGKP